MQEVRILLVDDHILFREGLTSLLNSQPDITIIGSAETVSDAIEKSHSLLPEIILMDFGLPDGTGLDAAKVILAEHPEVIIVFLTMHDDDDRLFEAIRVGAKGYLLKNVPASDLIFYLRGLERGEAAVSASMTTRIMNRIAESKTYQMASSFSLEELTQREMDVLRELNTGASNKEIAQRLIISERTVKNHVSSILSKLSVKNRREAIVLARRYGLF